MSEGYNGWTNYATWNVALWLDNDEYLQEQAEEIAREDGTPSDLADSYKSYVESLVEEIAPAVFEASFVADLFGSAFDSVDWYEIADHYLSDVRADA